MNDFFKLEEHDKAIKALEARIAKLEKKPRKGFHPPTPQEAQEYAKSINFRMSGEAFVAFYEQSGWKLPNGNPVKSWKACVKTWKARNGGEEKRDPISGRIISG